MFGISFGLRSPYKNCSGTKGPVNQESLGNAAQECLGAGRIFLRNMGNRLEVTMIDTAEALYVHFLHLE
jgi:hypothetical protein